MNTTQLACFAEVASALSFSRAAERLHLSQPTVSHQVKALEDELGAPLLVRSTRSVRLTDEGMVFLGYAHEILGLCKRARDQISQGRTPDAHALRIGVNDGMEAQLIAAGMGRMHDEDPAFDPQVRIGPRSALLEMLEGGTLDVVLAYRDPAGEPASTTVFRRLLEVPAACVCGTGHPLHAFEGERIGVDQLLGAGRAAIGDPRMTAVAIADAQREVGQRLSLQDVSMCPNTEAALALAAAGIAYTVLPDIPAMRRHDLRFIPIEGSAPIVVGVRVRRGRRPALLERFVELLGEELRREPSA